MNKRQMQLIESLVQFLEANGLGYFLVGATARNLLLESKGLEGVRRTNDWDFAVQMDSWKSFEKVASSLLGEGFLKTKSIHTFKYDDLIIDIVPFGQKLESKDGFIQFPEPSGMIMSTIGFEDFIKATELIQFNNITLRIGAYEALLGSKICA